MSGSIVATIGAAALGAISSRNSAKKAARAQEQSTGASMRFTREATEQARGDVQRMFPKAQESSRAGFQSALDVFNQSVPQQAQLFQQGNIGAQQALTAGLPQQISALLGGPVDISGIQPVQLQQPDMGYAKQMLRLPDALEAVKPKASLPIGFYRGISGGGPIGGFNNLGMWFGFNPNLPINNETIEPPSNVGNIIAGGSNPFANWLGGTPNVNNSDPTGGG